MRSLLTACWLLLWTLTVHVRCDDGSEIIVTENAEGIKLSCTNKYKVKKTNTESESLDSLDLDYKDENTGEYTCVQTGDPKTNVEGQQIYVKFRTCDNCIELDVASIAGVVVGDVVATIVIGVAVYLIASQTRTAPVTPHKKRSDRQPLVDMSREPNDHYQHLNHRQKDTYDVLSRR